MINYLEIIKWEGIYMKLWDEIQLESVMLPREKD